MNQQTKHRHKFSLFYEQTGNIPCGNIVYIIAFFIPVIIFTALYFAREIFPFGNNCYLRSDMYHQYAPFFSELWYKIRNAESLTYSWDIGMGTNFTELNHAPILPEHINCQGCRMDGAKTVYCESLCGIRQCALQKGVTTCGDCPELESCQMVGAIHSNNPAALENLKG